MKEILDIFKKTGAVHKGHFQLASGRHSDTYMQCAKLFMYPECSRDLCERLAKKIGNIGIDTVASPAIGGVIMGYEMAYQMKKPNIFFERVDGVMSLKRGFDVKPGERFLVVEDVVTTGGSVREVIDEIIKRGGIVAAVASVVDRSNGKVDFGADYYSLLCMDIESWEPADCPLCKQGLPITKPGTRASQGK